MSRNALLLTATVTPLAGLPSLARTDPNLRLKDYQAALSFYTGLLGNCFDLIIFAENSQSDISSLTASVSDYQDAEQIEFVSFSDLIIQPPTGVATASFS